MENYNGLIGSIAVGVLKNGLQKTTKVQLIVCVSSSRGGIGTDPDIVATRL
jgi:hypothetical protein